MEIFIECQFDNSYLIGDNDTIKTLSARHIKRYGTDILTGLIKKDGYKLYWLKTKWYYCHRLVCSHFITNENNWNEVNHLDGNKLNNHQSNLEWTTRKLNHKHRLEVLGQTNKGMPKGFKHSDDTKEAMRQAKLGRKRLNGKWL
jgi:hypothetical protein